MSDSNFMRPPGPVVLEAISLNLKPAKPPVPRPKMPHEREILAEMAKTMRRVVPQGMTPTPPPAPAPEAVVEAPKKRRGRPPKVAPTP